MHQSFNILHLRASAYTVELLLLLPLNSLSWQQKLLRTLPRVIVVFAFKAFQLSLRILVTLYSDIYGLKIITVMNSVI
jgi:hypothetical protein